MLTNFLVKIESGKPVFKSDHHRDLFVKFLSQYNDQEVYLTVEKKKLTRSQEQNNYYWLYLGVIVAEGIGNSENVEDLHSFLKGKFLTEKILEIFGEKTRRIKSTTSLSKGEFCEYLIKIQELTGVPLPDTQEYWGYSYHK